MKPSTLLKAGAALVLLMVLGAVGAITFINHSRPQPLGLAQAARHTTSPRPDDPLTLACRRPAVPDNSSSGVGGLWAVQAGSLVGYQAREKFAEVTSPHVAVARTDTVGGWLLVGAVPAGVQIETGCIAVDVRTLRSVDELPGFRTSDRDDIARQMLSSREHPYVIFQPYPAAISVDGTSNAVQHVQISGAVSKRLRVRGGLYPSPNVAAQNDDPTKAAIAAASGPYAANARPRAEFRVKSVQAVPGACPER